MINTRQQRAALYALLTQETAHLMLLSVVVQFSSDLCFLLAQVALALTLSQYLILLVIMLIPEVIQVINNDVRLCGIDTSWILPHLQNPRS